MDSYWKDLEGELYEFIFVRVYTCVDCKWVYSSRCGEVVKKRGLWII